PLARPVSIFAGSLSFCLLMRRTPPSTLFPYTTLFRSCLIIIQNKLFTLGAILATAPEKAVLKSGKERLNIQKISEEDLATLEQQIDLMETELPPMTHFVLPGGHPTVSYCHIARCVCRRAERLATQLHENEPTDEMVLKYLNRLSDY